MGLVIAMEALDGIPFLPDWPPSYRDLLFAACFRNRSLAIVLARQFCYHIRRFGSVEASAAFDLGASGTALFGVHPTRIIYHRSSNSSFIVCARLHSKRLVLSVFARHRRACRFCRHTLDCGKRGQGGDMEDDPAS